MGAWLSSEENLAADDIDHSQENSGADAQSIQAEASLEELSDEDDGAPADQQPAIQQQPPAQPLLVYQLQIQAHGNLQVATLATGDPVNNLQVVPADFLFHNAQNVQHGLAPDHTPTPIPPQGEHAGSPHTTGTRAAGAAEEDTEEHEGRRSHLKDHIQSHLGQPLLADCHLTWSDEKTRPLPCHKLILSRSPALNALLSDGCEVPVPHGVSTTAVRAVLKVLYGDDEDFMAEPVLERVADCAVLSCAEKDYVCDVLCIGKGGLVPLLTHLSTFAASERFSDACVRVGCGATVPVHRLVVCSRCFFRASLSPEVQMMESLNGVVDLGGLVDVDLEGLTVVLSFMYSEDMSHVHSSVAYKGLLCAHVLSMCDVVEECAKELQEGVRAGRVAPGDLPHLLHLADHAGVLGLRYVCMQQATKVLEEIQNLEGFSLLPEQIQEEVKILHRAEKDYLQGLQNDDKYRLGCGRELLAILQDSLTQQQERLREARALACADRDSLGQDAKLQDVLLRQERRLHELDRFIKSRSMLISAVS